MLYKEQVNYCNFSGYYNVTGEDREFVGYYKLSFENSADWTSDMDAFEVRDSLLRVAVIKSDGEEPLPAEIQVKDTNGFEMKWTRNSEGDIVIVYCDGNLYSMETSVDLSSEGYQTLNVPFDFSEHRVVTQHISFSED